MSEPENKHPSILRAKHAQATLDHFKDKPFRWGTRDCARMVAHHLRRMGHKVKLPPSGSYGSAIAAKKALTGKGFDTIGAAIDALGFERIPPAAAWTGDIVQGRDDEGVGLAALGIVLGNGRLVGFHPDAVGAAVLQPSDLETAWRIPLK